jgi:hypothetical protein
MICQQHKDSQYAVTTYSFESSIHAETKTMSMYILTFLVKKHTHNVMGFAKPYNVSTEFSSFRVDAHDRHPREYQLGLPQNYPKIHCHCPSCGNFIRSCLPKQSTTTLQNEERKTQDSDFRANAVAQNGDGRLLENTPWPTPFCLQFVWVYLTPNCRLQTILPNIICHA